MTAPVLEVVALLVVEEGTVDDVGVHVVAHPELHVVGAVVLADYA